MTHKRGSRLLLVAIILDAIAGVTDCTGQNRNHEPKPLIAAVWLKLGASGAKEVVIQPDLEKLKSSGFTLEQVSAAVDGRRFVEGKWSIEIDERKIDLATIAKLEVRELEAPPFIVHLGDGRSVLIKHDPKKVGEYVVPGHYFEERVRESLAEFANGDPGDVNVFSGIWVPGTVVPHLTERETMRHLSMGEPLKNFATVEVTK